MVPVARRLQPRGSPNADCRIRRPQEDLDHDPSDCLPSPSPARVRRRRRPRGRGGGLDRSHRCAVRRDAAGRDEAPRAQPAGSARRGEDLRADGKARRVHRVLVRRPERPGDRLRHPVDAHPQVHRRLHAGAVAGLRLRRRVEGRTRPGPDQRQGHHLGRHAPPGDLRDERRLRRAVPVHQRQVEPAPRRDRPRRTSRPSRSS